MSVSDLSESFNAVEKLAHNLTSRNAEVRERAAESLLLKLELQIVPEETLLQDYHSIIGQALMALNQSIERPAPTAGSNLIKILRIFGRSEKGRGLLRKYGVIEFMGEFLDFHKKAGNETAVDEIEALLFSLVNKPSNLFATSGSGALSSIYQLDPTVASRLSQSLQTTSKQTLDAPESKFAATTLPGVTGVNALLHGLGRDPRLDRWLGPPDRFRLAEEDRNFLVELSTFLKFSKKEEFGIDSFVFRNVCKALENFPMCVFSGGFSESFLGIVRLVATCKSTVLFAILYHHLLDWVGHEVDNRRQFLSRGVGGKGPVDPEAGSAELLSAEPYLQDSYPPLLNSFALWSEDEPGTSKMLVSNMVEVVLRGFVNCLRHPAACSFLTGKLQQTIQKLIEFSELVGVEAVLELMLLGTLGFWETTLGTLGDQTDLPLRHFEFMEAYSRLVLWLLRKLAKKSERKDQAGIKFGEKIGKSFDLRRLGLWFVMGLMKPEDLPQVDEILSRIDPAEHSRFQATVNLGSSRQNLEQNYSQKEINWPEKMQNVQATLATLAETTKILAVFEVADHDPSPFLDLYLLVTFRVREAQRAARHLDSETFQAIQQYTQTFENCLRRLLGAHTGSKNSFYLLKSIESILKDKPQRLQNPRSSFDLESELRAVLRTSSLLTTIILASLDTSQADGPSSPLLTITIDLLSYFLTNEKKIPAALDYFLLVRFLTVAAAKNPTGKSLANFLTTKFPDLEKAEQLAAIFSKDHIAAFQAFNSLAFDVKGDKDFSLAAAKKMVAMGAAQDLRISPKHHYHGLVDPQTGSAVFKGPLRVLAALANDNIFVDSTRMQEVYDILELFLNPKLDQQIRLEALNQCVEAMMSLRKNKEARKFSACLANMASDRLLQETPSAFTEVYVKVLVGFLCFQKYNAGLKIKIAKDWRDSGTREGFKKIADLLLAISKTPSQEFRANTLAFLQAVFFSTIFWSPQEPQRTEASLNSTLKSTTGWNLPQQISENPDDSEDTLSNRPIRLWSFDARDSYNFLGSKLLLFSDQFKQSDLNELAVAAIRTNRGAIFSFLDRIEAHFDSKISELKRGLDRVRTLVDLLPVAENLGHLLCMFQRHRSLVEAHRDPSKVISHLKYIFDSTLTKVETAAESKEPDGLLGEIILSAIFSVSQKHSSDRRMVEEFGRVAWKRVAGFSHQSLHLNLEVLGLFLKLTPSVPDWFSKSWELNNGLLASLSTALKSTETHFLGPLIAKASQTQLVDLKDQAMVALSKTMSAFKPSNCFQDLDAKIRTFRIFLRAANLPGGLKTPQVFEFFVRAKDACRSPNCALRFLGWMVLAACLKASPETQFVQETFYRCKEHMGTAARLENPKINAVVLSALAQIVPNSQDGDWSADWSFLKKISARKEDMGVLENCAWLHLLRQFRTDAQNPDLDYIRREQQNAIDFLVASQLRVGWVFPIESAASGKKSVPSWEFRGVSEIDESNFAAPALLLPEFVFRNKLFQPHQLDLLKPATNFSEVRPKELRATWKATHSLFLTFLDQLASLSLLTGGAPSNLGTSAWVNILRYLNQLGRFAGGELPHSRVFVSVTEILSRTRLPQQELAKAISEVSEFISKPLEIQEAGQETLESFLVTSISLLKNQTPQDADSLSRVDESVLRSLTKNLVSKCSLAKARPATIQNLTFVLSMSNEAKEELLTSRFLESNQREISRAIVEKDSRNVQTLLQIFRALFFPARSPLPSSSKVLFYPPKDSKGEKEPKFESIKASFRAIFFILAKIHGVEWPGDGPNLGQSTGQVLTNWHLNPRMSRFVEKQALKGKHFILNSVLETVKEAKRISTPDFLNALSFLSSISSCEFLAQLLGKGKVLTGLTSRLLALQNSDKSQGVSIPNLRQAWPVLDLLFAFSFHKVTHPRMFEGKEAFSACYVFAEKKLRLFLTQKRDAVNLGVGAVAPPGKDSREATQTQIADQENSDRLAFSPEVSQMLVLFSNLLLSNPTKALVTETEGFVGLVLDCLAYTSVPKDQLLVTQILYNIVFKDGSAVRRLQTPRVALALADLAAETKDRLRKKTAVVLRESDGTEESLRQTLKNIEAIESLTNFPAQ